jgi:hypothetical protein
MTGEGQVAVFVAVYGTHVAPRATRFEAPDPAKVRRCFGGFVRRSGGALAPACSSLGFVQPPRERLRRALHRP